MAPDGELLKLANTGSKTLHSELSMPAFVSPLRAANPDSSVGTRRTCCPIGMTGAPDELPLDPLLGRVDVSGWPEATSKGTAATEMGLNSPGNVPCGTLRATPERLPSFSKPVREEVLGSGNVAACGTCHGFGLNPSWRLWR